MLSSIITVTLGSLRRQLVVGVLLTLIAASEAVAQTGPPLLRGLAGVHPEIYGRQAALPKPLVDSLYRVIDRHLTSGRVPILDHDVIKRTPGKPLLEVRVQRHAVATGGRDSVTVLHVELDISEYAGLERNRAVRADALVWRGSRFLTATPESWPTTLPPVVADLVDQFAADYRRARSTAPTSPRR